MSNSLIKKLTGFLEDKQIWVWLLTYLAITGILFGVLFGVYSLLSYLLGIVPWIVILILIAGGLIWGTVQYSRAKNNGKERETPPAGAVKE